MFINWHIICILQFSVTLYLLQVDTLSYLDWRYFECLKQFGFASDPDFNLVTSWITLQTAFFFSFSSLNGFLPCTYKKYGFGIRLTWVWLLFHRTLPIHWEYCELYLQNMFRIPPLLSSFTATVLVQSSTWAIVYNHLSGLPIFTLASSSQLIRDINIRVKNHKTSRRKHKCSLQLWDWQWLLRV